MAASSGKDAWTLEFGSSVDPAIAMLPLGGDVTQQLVADLEANGLATYCGDCGKPFNAVRKSRGIVRITHVAPGIGLFATCRLLCGRCLAEAKRNGNRVSPRIVAEAREAVSAAILLTTPPKGRS